MTETDPPLPTSRPHIEADVARAREILSHLIELSGLSRREVERRLLEQACGTDLGRLLSGRLDLKLRHVVDLCRVIGVFPLEFFQMIWRDCEERSPLLQRLDALIPAKLPRLGPSTPQSDDLLRRFADLLQQLETSTKHLTASRQVSRRDESRKAGALGARTSRPGA